MLSSEQNNSTLIKMKESIKEKDKIIEKLLKELENAKMTIFKMKNISKERNSVSNYKTNIDHPNPFPLSERKKSVRINLASDNENSRKDILSPRLNIDKNLVLLKRYESVKNDYTKHFKESSLGKNKKTYSSFLSKYDKSKTKLEETYSSKYL